MQYPLKVRCSSSLEERDPLVGPLRAKCKEIVERLSGGTALTRWVDFHVLTLLPGLAASACHLSLYFARYSSWIIRYGPFRCYV
ncbi:hypothetical protein P152DRAFT_284213 [Eremomyces bilateralis CBS 781.70]|uniref:Uncharacterized protein n=1 Tax=Eremomyces bilateralis CBS 781.70 TaxID=1392243 RepID=A0A6G1FQA3_9PEZI|nr:uncharacterized protein P152DRAFT_284213 [Eremomyces bilateralis CBS 781.70]KAF1807908.1 hypothetical protein P152DRAFT_284213 [Eremomyces bilateralis CBS 781.70]